MAKSVITNRCLFNAGSSGLRRFSTAVNASVKSEQEDHRMERRVGGFQTLYKRLSLLGLKRGCVAETINEYVREGRMARKDMLENCITELRRYGKHHLALEIFEWMEKGKINLGYADHARRLDLTAKVEGIAAAENYFSGLSPAYKNLFTYGALLNSYCKEKMVDKALELFEKMDILEIGHNTLTFSNMMAMYMRLGQPEMVPTLVLQMKEREIQPSTFIYNLWMSSYSSLNDIQGVERVFEEIKKDGQTKCDWTTYSNLAIAYMKAGLNEKAELALKKCEEEARVMRPRDPKAYGWLISLYAQLSNTGEVHRVWTSLKSRVKVVSNMTYLTMLQALSKLNDINGMKKCFEEWESRCHFYDTRLVNVMMGAYLKNDMVEEAKTVLDRALSKSTGSFFVAWEILTTYYLNNGQMDLALKCFEAASSEINEFQWHPKPENVSKFLSHFAEEKDIDGAEKFCECLRKFGPLDSDVYKVLLQTYVAAGRRAPSMFERLEEDGVELSLELENLLVKVSP